jgi:hypothetical protein
MTAISCQMDRARRQLSNGGLGLKIGAREVAESRAAKMAILVAFCSVFEGGRWQIFMNRRP